MTEENLTNFISRSFINEQFFASAVTPCQMDILLKEGWRHFGTEFFRYNFGFYRNEIRHVTPLRIRLSNFSFSKRHRRILRKNGDLETLIRPVEITPEKIELFELHKKRFDHGIPDSIYDFLSAQPASVPSAAMEVCVYKAKQLVAASFFDTGEDSFSGIYGMFHPDESARSLGIYTLLVEIKNAVESGKEFYYLGYAYEGKSFYDYKKQFNAIEQFDWKDSWKPFEKKTGAEKNAGRNREDKRK